jgi:TRAP-type C4-dicarboxylate transport system substrate-binding protein
MVRSPLLAASLVISLVLVAAGCDGDRDKAGGTRSVSLTLYIPDGANEQTEVFVREARRRSHGTLRIVVDGGTYMSPANEKRLAAALRSGSAELAFLPSRAWESQGIQTFRVLQAPFLLTGQRVLRRIVTGPVGTAILRGTDRIGVLGLALLPGAPRRVLGRRPFTTPESLRGARIRIIESATTAATVRALGAFPEVHLDSEVSPALKKGQLDGVESSTGFILQNNFQVFAHYLATNVVLFPRTDTIAVSRRAFQRLASDQQRALREAAAATLAASLHSAPTDAANLEKLCQAGVHVIRATPSDLTALRAAAEPVYQTLRRDPATANLLREVERLSAAAPSEATLMPAKCEAAPTTTNQSAGSTIPEGKYVTTLTEKDFSRFHGNAKRPTETWTTTLRGGHFWQVTTRAGEPPGDGIYTVRGNHLVTFVYLSPADFHGVRETVRWSYYRGELSFEIVSVTDPDSVVFYRAHPWHRVG